MARTEELRTGVGFFYREDGRTLFFKKTNSPDKEFFPKEFFPEELLPYSRPCKTKR
jgi:hypothetical protein